MTQKRLLVAGGVGFIGSAVARHLIGESKTLVFNVDKLLHADNLHSLAAISDSPDYQFAHLDICDRDEMWRLFDQYYGGLIRCLRSQVTRSLNCQLTRVTLFDFTVF